MQPKSPTKKKKIAVTFRTGRKTNSVELDLVYVAGASMMLLLEYTILVQPLPLSLRLLLKLVFP